MTLKELVTSTGTPGRTACASWSRPRSSDASAAKELLDEVVRLGLVVDLGADEATLRKGLRGAGAAGAEGLARRAGAEGRRALPAAGTASGRKGRRGQA